MKSAAIRQAFLDYFASKGHTVVSSSPLVPANDPTLLFTNAGMVQFKDVFLGKDVRSYRRATSSQRCVRAGGKHNDLENVGYTARHHTFFEMLGNFSFGDYFKREAITYAWEFLTQTLGLPEEKLWVTVFKDDQEAEDIWLQELGVSAERFSRLGEKDNFWSMGDTGPCGPCSEIFYDHGPDVAGGPPGSPEEDGDRYIEIWNLVFMQYDRAAEGTLTPLPRPSVDTGMGLERIAAVMQGVHNNYEIDLFQGLLDGAAEIAELQDNSHTSLRVIADHMRSASFLVVDTVVPSNEGRGYVLRRIIRRAIRHGHKLGINQPFMHRLVAPLAREMGVAFPELVAVQSQVEKVLLQEEQQFARTLDQGMRILEQDLENISGGQIPGATIFRLYDTYGFPVDLTADIARERGLSMDMAGFEQAMAEQRQRARAASQFGVEVHTELAIEGETEFRGYRQLRDGAQVTNLFREGQPVESLKAGDQGAIVLKTTPFYAESGGQVGDTGQLEWSGGSFRVDDTRKQGQVFVHYGQVVGGVLTRGVQVQAQVDASKRRATALNHSATHLLHAALKKVLGEHVAQKGSLVDSDRLRFDFSHFEAVTPEQLAEIEAIVNEKVQQNSPVNIQVMALDDAMAQGVTALFGEKYGAQVRVLSMADDFSVELCGGTHVDRTADIAVFKICSEQGVAAGVRRIEALTGNNALDWQNKVEQNLLTIADIVKGSRDNVAEKVLQLVARNKQLEKELADIKAKLASSAGSDLASGAVDVKGIKVLAHAFEGVDGKSLLATLDQLKSKLGTAAVLLAAVNGQKISLVAGVTKDATDRIKAGELVNHVAQQVGGRGGGRPDMAQAGGNDPSALPQAIASVVSWVETQIPN